jgi:HSP20 family protein
MLPVKSISGRKRDVWDPFRDLLRMHEDMDRTFASLWRMGDGDLIPSGTWAPSVEVYEDKNSIIVEAELPGVTKDNVSLNLTDGALTIKGERKDEREKKGEHYLLHEATYGSFHRVIPLPQAVDNVKVKAEYKDGVLKVTLPKVEESKNREIKIEVQ